MSDAELLRAFIDARDDLAFGRLVARHAAGLRRIAMLETGNAEAAEDVTQAAFIVLSRRPKPAFRSARRRGSAEAWLHQVARYAAANWRRAEQRRRKREKAVAQPDRVERADPSQPGDLAEAVASALRTLRRRDRRLILLRHVEEKPWSEVAARVGMSPEAARKATDRASEHLRVALESHGVYAAPAAIVAGLGAIGGGAVSAAAVGSANGATTLSASELAKGAMAMMNLKSAASVCILAGALMLGGVGATALSQEQSAAPTPRSMVATSEPGALVARLSDGTTVRFKAVSDGSGLWWSPDGSNSVRRASPLLDLEMEMERKLNEWRRRNGEPEEPVLPKIGLELDFETEREALGEVQIHANATTSYSVAVTSASSECPVVLQPYPEGPLEVEIAVAAGEPAAEVEAPLHGLEHQTPILNGAKAGLTPLYRRRLGNDEVTGTTVSYPGDLMGYAIVGTIVKEDGTRVMGLIASRSKAGDTHVLNFTFGTEPLPERTNGRLALTLMPLELVRFTGFALSEGQQANPKMEVLSHRQYVALLRERSLNAVRPVPPAGNADDAASE